MSEQALKPGRMEPQEIRRLAVDLADRLNAKVGEMWWPESTVLDIASVLAGFIEEYESQARSLAGMVAKLEAWNHDLRAAAGKKED